MWCGKPFLIVGEPKIVDRYFELLDADSTEVLEDRAKFWLLTDSCEYTHRQLPDDRLVSLD